MENYFSQKTARDIRNKIKKVSVHILSFHWKVFITWLLERTAENKISVLRKTGSKGSLNGKKALALQV